MPVSDPRTGYAAIWFISCLLFVSIAVGGGFLVMYMILPESKSTYWLPVAGVTLVCLPWMFWFCTCMYRILSRLFGIRINASACTGGGGCGGSRGGGGGGSVLNSTRGRNVNSNHASVNNNTNNNSESLARNNNAGQNRENGQERKEGDSVTSRESEIPLTSSMGP